MTNGYSQSMRKKSDRVNLSPSPTICLPRFPKINHFSSFNTPFGFVFLVIKVRKFGGLVFVRLWPVNKGRHPHPDLLEVHLKEPVCSKQRIFLYSHCRTVLTSILGISKLGKVDQEEFIAGPGNNNFIIILSYAWWGPFAILKFQSHRNPIWPYLMRHLN